MSIRVADFIVKFLYEYGVMDYFYLPGGGMMHLTDGLACNKNIRHYCLHHEQAISMALECYARTTGHFGVGYFTTGPGTTNAITGLAGAWLDSVPCMFISGQAKRKEAVYAAGIPGIRQIGVQEINILPIVESITKYAAFVDNPEDIQFHLQKAVYLAKDGRPGPVWLDVPLDVQGALIDEKTLRKFVPPKNKVIIAPTDIAAVVNYLHTAKRPLILAGYGVRIAGAISELLAFVSKFQIPVVTTYCGVDCIDSSHPQYVGRIGVKGDRAGNLAMQNADLLIVIGSSMPVANTGYSASEFARKATVVVVDIEPASHQKKTMHIEKFIHGDALEFLQTLLPEVKSIPIDSTWINACVRWKEKYPVCLPEYADNKEQVNMYYFIDILSKKLTSDDIVVTDAGSAFYVGSQGIKIKQGMRYITSGGLSTMGYSLPASIGASIARGKKRVMCVTGDGSFQQNIQELQSVVHYKLPIKIFVLNNGGYLSMRFTQNKYFGGRFMGEGPRSGISFPDTKKIAWAYGIPYVIIKNSQELPKKLEGVLKEDGPVVCEVMNPQNQLVIPTVASQRLPDGTMASRPLEDMFPFLPREEFLENMFIPALEEKSKQ